MYNHVHFLFFPSSFFPHTHKKKRVTFCVSTVYLILSQVAPKRRFFCLFFVPPLHKWAFGVANRCKSSPMQCNGSSSIECASLFFIFWVQATILCANACYVITLNWSDSISLSIENMLIRLRLEIWCFCWRVIREIAFNLNWMWICFLYLHHEFTHIIKIKPFTFLTCSLSSFQLECDQFF